MKSKRGFFFGKWCHFCFYSYPWDGQDKRERERVVFWTHGPTRKARSWGAVSVTATRWRQAAQAALGSAAQHWKLRVLVLPGSPWLALHGVAGHSTPFLKPQKGFAPVQGSQPQGPWPGIGGTPLFQVQVGGHSLETGWGPANSAEGQHPPTSRAAGAVGPGRAARQATTQKLWGPGRPRLCCCCRGSLGSPSGRWTCSWSRAQPAR